MIRAESYIRKMADGINPVTDEPAADDDMVNNIRITRCLYYVSDILKQVIANGGSVKKKTGGSGKKADFFITDEQRTSFTVFERSIYIKELADKLNELADVNNCKKFAAKWVTEYLVSIGMLVVDDGTKRATEDGAALGITSEKRQANYSPKEYWVNMYSPEAQRFIIDNINSIIAFAKTPQYRQQTHPNSADNDTAAE